ncbi:hypothetical protein RclHR1_05270006 [Rhizophagus clarus]|uniref:Uncharacterized protein n=1 Tax=Rhizophagus clarus TaxID=94130 RepID=A0A2Z6SED5_9GLOM|nr:hypothetical protein RclHR1_05270006 [Rhizophagus clarus]GES79471.1 hypothetical protein GLOIN_2v1555982 [Rhizophagus clarus]
MKFFTVLLIAITLIATFAVAIPTPNDDGGKQEIHVSSPGPGPWAVKSSQAVNWWSLHIPSDSVVGVKIIDKDDNFIVFEGDSHCGTGTLNFEVGEDWKVHHEFYAVVFLKDNEDCKGFSGKFTIFKTDEYGGGYGYEQKKNY